MFPKSWKNFSSGYNFNWLPHRTQKIHNAPLRSSTTIIIVTTLPPASHAGGTCTHPFPPAEAFHSQGIEGLGERGPGGYSLKSKCFHIRNGWKRSVWSSGNRAGTQGPYLYFTQTYVYSCAYTAFTPERGQGGLLVVDILLLHAHSVPVLSNWYDIVYLTVLPPVM